ncbi:MAG: glycerol-3-phosphate dehydrogenase/oxidase [Lutibacter sp.]|jgi:glycerol-3-phosphate dehydrogenase|nr:glycerol-3-phosphate dehydrogenase/oxidase [Lutibacter sp.]
MNRKEMLRKLSMGDSYDFIVIGGGSTGIGIALEAAARDYSVLLLEKADFAKSTSSKSTKLVHGGVRYLAQGEIGLVREAVRERGYLIRNAPHLVKNQCFIIPANSFWEHIKYTIGLVFYDLLAGGLSLGNSRRISRSESLRRLPALEPKRVKAGTAYHDGQFDDTRLAINALQTAATLGAVVLNYCEVTALSKDERGQVNGLVFIDQETGISHKVRGEQVVNATGVFADTILAMDNPSAASIIAPSQGIHIVLDRKFFPGKEAVMVPKTTDGRVLFLIPWHHRILVGTTDTPVKNTTLEPVALEEEIDFILHTLSNYLINPPKRSDVLSVFAGLRPLAVSKEKGRKTKEISRSHKIITAPSGLLTIIGGKWTTFRKMGQDLVDKTEKKRKWNPTSSNTKQLKLQGYQQKTDRNDPLSFYGSDKEPLLDLARELSMDQALSDLLPVISAQVVWAVRHEMARTVEDFLARRTRCQLLDARESIRMAPKVAEIMARELQKDLSWQERQIASYKEVTLHYIL